MVASIIDGKLAAQTIRTTVKENITAFQQKHPHFLPCLAVILVGDRGDSSTYVGLKQKAAEAVGIKFIYIRLSQSVDQAELSKQVQQLNDDTTVHGILVQMPLPEQINSAEILELIDPKKDVDGFHPYNIGKLNKKNALPYFLPCTPKGVIHLIKLTNTTIAGKKAVVLGRSDIVGSPVASMLTAEDATVTQCHSKTENVKLYVREADIVVAAIGKPGFVKGEWIKPGAIVIDVGTNYIEDSTKKSGVRCVGDVEYKEASQVASAITPVPGGVGPMTIACLIENTYLSAKRLFEEL
ncbi:tetrahydrofolate dehydrogenase/cyclohydrolase [Sporodiniella umbellata]|nr:tetrahydrofolate dehydrogenase/cyclohydrolase [Sporodiniella umbellata]